MKKTLLALAVALVAPMGSAAAQPSCTGIQFFTNVTVTGCSGFFYGNENPPTAESLAGLSALTGGSTARIEGNIEFPESFDGFIDFVKPLNGETVVGIHWGNGSVWEANGFTEKIPGSPLGSVFVKFNATNVDKLIVKENWRNSISNSALYKTTECKQGSTLPECGGGGDCTIGGSCVVPEPSTYILMASGLFGLGFLARRRRNNA